VSTPEGQKPLLLFLTQTNQRDYCANLKNLEFFEKIKKIKKIVAKT